MRSVALLLCLTLAGCASTAPLKLLTGGGGPTVNSNAQIGSENTQQVVAEQNDVTAGRDVNQSTSPVTSGTVEKVVITNDRIPPWVLLLAIIGWLLPTPTQIGETIGGIFVRRRSDVPAVSKKSRPSTGRRREPRFRRQDGDNFNQDRLWSHSGSSDSGDAEGVGGEGRKPDDEV